MRRNWLAIAMVIAVAALMIGAAACGSKRTSTSATATTISKTPSATSGKTPSGAQSAVQVTLAEYLVKPQPTSVPAGSVTFNAKNIGGTDHSLVVIRTDLAPDALPTKADGSVDEAGTRVTMVDQVTVKAQQQKPLTVTLTPGNYVLICNVVQTSNGQTISHYAKGMTVAFTVTP